MRACCQDSSPTTFQDTLASQTSSCLPHLCIHGAPAKIHRLRKLPLNHFPALAPITGIEVVRSKRKGMQSILFACHQCHFAARQLKKDTQRQEFLAAGERARQESLATERPTPQVGCFTKQHTLSVQLSTNYTKEASVTDTLKNSISKRPPSYQWMSSSLGTLVSHHNLPFCHGSYADFFTCLSAGIKRLLKSLCSKFIFLSSFVVHMGLKEQYHSPQESEKGPRQRKEPKIYYLLPKPISFIWQDLNRNNFDCCNLAALMMEISFCFFYFLFHYFLNSFSHSAREKELDPA